MQQVEGMVQPRQLMYWSQYELDRLRGHFFCIARGKRPVSPLNRPLHLIRISTKTRLMKALVWFVEAYGCESWTLRKNEETCLDTFDMKRLRKILRVSRTAQHRFLTKLE